MSDETRDRLATDSWLVFGGVTVVVLIWIGMNLPTAKSQVTPATVPVQSQVINDTEPSTNQLKVAQVP